MTPADKQHRQAGRLGYSTGACAAAASLAAVHGLIHGILPKQVYCQLPNAQRVAFSIAHGQQNAHSACATVIKDAGDDPDCTHGAAINACVQRLPDQPGEITLQGGEGIGIVTLPGLGLSVGDPAINPIPQRNIKDNVRQAAQTLLPHHGLAITLSVTNGAQLAQKTLNPRLGILGGLSILGTTGLVRPYSTAAFRLTVIKSIAVAHAQGLDTVVLSTGGRTEKCAMRTWAHLPPPAFVQMGDFVGAAFKTLIRHQIPHVILSAMVGKLTKIAQGHAITHAHHAPLDTRLVAQIAQECGVDPALCQTIAQAKTARFAAEQLHPLGLAEIFHQTLAHKARQAIYHHYPGNYTLNILVCDFNGQPITHI